MNFLASILSLLFFISSPIYAVETCPTGEIRYREGGNCEKESPFIHNKINQYPITCQNTPSVTYHRESTTPPPNLNTAIVKVESDISQAELGSFGPNLEAINSKTPDALAALYPYNALFDKPPNTSPFNERESFRTYWRLLSSLQQANAKAAYLTQTNQDKINNQTFKFFNSQDQEKEWTTKDLYNKLPSCLKTYPVCEDFIKVYQNLNIDTQEAYDALMPFNFDNLRGYEVIKYNSPSGGTVTHIMAENLPYVAAINQGLLSPQTGLLNTLSPSWINPLRQNNLTSDSIIKQSQENTLINEIENYTQITKCQNPAQGIYLPAPLTFPKGLDNSSYTLEQTFEIPITTRVETRYTALGIPYNVYVSDGAGLGSSSVQVLNNPKQKDISLGLAEDTTSSLFHMFTTSSSQQPYQDQDVHAPLSQRTAEAVSPNSGTVGLTEPTTEVARKGGEPHVKLCELRNKWLIPASLQRNVDCQNLDSSLSNLNPTITPPPNALNCNQFAPAVSSSAVLTAEQINTYSFSSGHSKENVILCYNDLVGQALAASYDPAFTMAIWLEESGASFYSAYPNVADFGCTVGVPTADFTAQIACFHRLIPSYATADHWQECRGADNKLSMFEFLLIYEGGYDSCRAGTFTKEPQFLERIKQYFSTVSGGRTLNLNQILTP